VKGAFTGAIRDKIGVFQAADGGTLFLDEIGDTSPLLQLKLLRVLQESEIRRVGDDRAMKVNVRLITATNRNLQNLMAEGTLREDFYYRIHVFEIILPPLRERRADIPLLVNHFMEDNTKVFHREVNEIAQDALQRLQEYSWPGNVRELKNAIEHAFVTVADNCIRLWDLPPEVQRPSLKNSSPSASSSPLSPLDMTEEIRIREALHQAHGNKTEAAKLLGVSRVTLWKKLKFLDLQSPASA
jgi:transcriptional regulator with PAS, ATPase and Fis domain